MSPKNSIILSCEHGGNKIPSSVKENLHVSKRLIESHQAFDRGALDLALFLKKQLRVPLINNEMTRLILDYNRTPTNKNYWGILSEKISEKDKQRIVEDNRCYTDQLFEFIKRNYKSSHVIHLSIHSFTPVYKGKIRKTEIGLLYDPARESERRISRFLKSQLSTSFRVHFNRPYRGTSDGLTKYFRSKFKKHYSGIEIEINQDFVKSSLLSHVKKELLKSIKDLPLLRVEN